MIKSTDSYVTPLMSRISNGIGSSVYQSGTQLQGHIKLPKGEPQ